MEDIFARQGFDISRATQSAWCGDVADLVEPLHGLMAERVRASHVVATDDTHHAHAQHGQNIECADGSMLTFDFLFPIHPLQSRKRLIFQLKKGPRIQAR
ncbi:MAG TPA: transposase [Edaphobacter sp.]|uniref:IS66 family transposase n=1 Tax=Edaphobacter sp. TaxID=1934404 RepID=UPI002BD7B7D0|nr:transposase [Edaphobacter sp.]HUZ94126.1 transposase [Edaphobacter sp.]